MHSLAIDDASPASPMVLRVVRDHTVMISLATMTTESSTFLEIRAETEFSPSDSILTDFNALEARKLPEGSSRPDSRHPDAKYIDQAGNIAGGLIPGLTLMPQQFQDFARQVRSELSTAAEQAVGVLRWRSRTIGPSRPFASRGVMWSIDGSEWNRLPTSGYVELGGATRLEPGPQTQAELQAIIDSGAGEPLAHVLFREAHGQRTGNARGALVMAVVALEVTVKEYVAFCVPDSRWVMENLPSPPVVQMLTEYLPTLRPPSPAPGLAAFASDDPVIKALRKATLIRNQTTHRGATVSRQNLITTLRAVRTILWKLDAARGYMWADQHVAPSLDEDLSEGHRRI